MSHDSTPKIGVSTATITGMNAMIGSGIFIVPATLASFVGPAGILAFIFVIFSVLFIALSLAKVAARFPQEGSFYAYTKQWAGHTMGLITITSYLVGLLIAMGLLAQIAGNYLAPLVPGLGLSASTLGLSILVGLIALNMFGVVLSQLGQQILICSTVFPLITITAMCLTKIDLSYLSPFAPYGFTNVLKATRKVIFGFFGFECAASLFNIVKDPARNVPRALVYSILLVGLIYTLFVSAIILSIPLDLFADPNVPIPDILGMLFPENPWLIRMIHISMLSAMIGTIHSMIWSSSQLLISIIKRFKTPAISNLVDSGVANAKTSVLFVGFCISLSFSLLHNIDLFFNLTAIFIVFAYVMSMITLLFIKDEWKRTYNIPTFIGIGTAMLIFTFAVEGLISALR